MSVYGPSTVKRKRRTDAELADLDALIIDVVEEEHPVTLRGVYYRVVSRGGAEKTEAAYRVVGRRLLYLRRAGLIPYDRITDGTRWVTKPDSYDDMEDALISTAELYRRSLWRGQPVGVQVYTEKDAISGVVLPITSLYDVPLGVVRGYCSETFAYEVAQSVQASPKPTFIYQLGDHDPSGIGAWRDFAAKIAGFLPQHRRIDVHFRRLAVTPEQIAELNLPTRPTKTSDTRARNFVGGSVEVDAIPATELREIIAEAIKEHIDPAALSITQKIEASEREILSRMPAQAIAMAEQDPSDFGL